MPRVWADAEMSTECRTFSDFGIALHNPPEAAGLPAAVKIAPHHSLADISLARRHAVPVVLDAFSLLSKVSYSKSALTAWFSRADLLVLDVREAELILGYSLRSQQALQKAADELLALGNQSIFLIGRHLSVAWEHDYWTNGNRSFWLTQSRISHTSYIEARALLSAAITASLALGYELDDALIIARMYVHQVQRQTQLAGEPGGFPEQEVDLPYLASQPLYEMPQPFRACSRLGLYPVVDSFSWVKLLLQMGVKTIQLRIKEQGKTLEQEIRQSIALAREYGATLYINDYWELALKFAADGVHLGQSDLDSADLDAIRKQGLLLGISTHCYAEVARAHALNPSYMAIGPIYPTTSKEMPFSAQGVARLKRWQRTLDYPLVAIGGINIARMPEVVATGVAGIALISAITKAHDPRQATEELMAHLGQ